MRVEMGEDLMESRRGRQTLARLGATDGGLEGRGGKRQQDKAAVVAIVEEVPLLAPEGAADRAQAIRLRDQPHLFE